jgi:hypothetical protein
MDGSYTLKDFFQKIPENVFRHFSAKEFDKTWRILASINSVILRIALNSVFLRVTLKTLGT